MRALLALLLALPANAVPPGPEAPVYPKVGAAVARPPGAAREMSVIRAQAMEHFKEGLFREAAALYQREAASAAVDSDAWRDSMWAHWYSGQYSAAALAGHRVSDLAPRDLEAVNLTAAAHARAGQREAALKDYLRSLDLDPMQVPARRAAARLYEWLREYRLAIHYAHWALDGGPDEPTSHAVVARARFYRAEYALSAKAWRRAVKLDPGNRDYRLAQAEALYFAGQEEDALAVARRLLDEHPRFWRAVDFVVNVALVRRDFDAAAAAMERALEEVQPADEPRLMFLARLYATLGREEDFDRVVDRALALDPDNGSALLALASRLVQRGRPYQAERLFRRLTALNPGSGEAWRGLADALAVSSQTAQAVAAIEAARRLDPTDPHLLILHTRYLFLDGRRAQSKKMLLDWLRENEEATLPVLLYHGVTPFPRDPMLANPVHVTTGILEDHIRALSERGFVPITAEMAAAWFKHQLELPPNAVLVTFDDGRLDSIRHAEPVLRKYGYRASMFLPVAKTRDNDPRHLAWADLRRMLAGKVWEVQAHGYDGHTYVERDRGGRPGLFLANRRWLKDKGRLETVEEWIDRAARDHELSKEELERRLGRLPSTFAFPEGDYGQTGVPNFPESSDLNLKLCRQAFAVCWHQDSKGINVRTRDPALATRVEPRQGWRGRDLVELIGDEDPRVLVRRQLIARAIFDRRAREALHWLSENQRSGASDSLNLSDEARIRFSFGDRPRGLTMARQAALLDDNDEEYPKLVEQLEEKMRPVYGPTAKYFRDNRARRHLTSEQALGSYVAGYNMLRPLHAYGSWSEEGFTRAQGHGVGLEATRYLTLFHAATVKAVGYALPGRSARPYSASASVRSAWADPYWSLVEAGRTSVLTARALEEDLSEEFASVTAGFSQTDEWHFRATGRAARVDDGVRRLTASLRASQPVSEKLLSLRAVYQLTLDTSEGRSARYYAPDRLVMNQLGLSWTPRPLEWLGLELSYLPGYGMESGAFDEEGGDQRATRIVHRLDAGVNMQWERLSLRPTATLTRAPLYTGDTYGVAVGWKF